MSPEEAPPPAAGAFDLLSPEAALDAVEDAYALSLDGSVRTYSSYVNRVYGLRDEDGREYVAKFYRPKRWSFEAILEEHRFLADCIEAELPVVPALLDPEGGSLSELEIENEEGEPFSFPFALFPKRGGRGFDAESDSDWLRLGALTGRLHALGKRRTATRRLTLGPKLASSYLSELLPLLNPEIAEEFRELCSRVLASIETRLGKLGLQRIHGDLHRGNILDRAEEGLLLIDFDDMLMGPPVQDLWLLLPDRAPACRRELGLLMEGYSEFAELETGSLALIEPLRFIRMLHFLAWRARQREDNWFRREFPDWGGRAFWIKELEDFRDQARAVGEALEE